MTKAPTGNVGVRPGEVLAGKYRVAASLPAAAGAPGGTFIGGNAGLVILTYTSPTGTCSL